MRWTPTKLQFLPLYTGWHWSLPVCIVLNHVPSVAGSIKSVCRSCLLYWFKHLWNADSWHLVWRWIRWAEQVEKLSVRLRCGLDAKNNGSKLENCCLQHFCQCQGNLSHFPRDLARFPDHMHFSSRKCMILTNGMSLEKEMKKLSSDTRFSAKDEVTTEKWSIKHQIPNFYQIFFVCVLELCNNDILPSVSTDHSSKLFTPPVHW